MKLSFLLIAIVVLGWACSDKEKTNYSVRMVDSEMKRLPELWQTDFVKKPKWDYTQGLLAKAIFMVAERDNNELYFKYTEDFADKFIDSAGNIATYKESSYNLDRVNGGKFLLSLYHKTQNEKYLKAVKILRKQLESQPRTSEGGFWHKKIYPHQMWLDGLYMGAPFYAECAKEFGEAQAFDDVVNQFETVYRHTYDAKTGLNYHGWDESREQQWANQETGCSSHVWGRAMGWYSMALVDVLDFIPENHPGRESILNILNKVAEGVKNSADVSTGLWWQVMDQPGREGNYLEATCSSMFVYALLKGVRQGYLDKDIYLPVAKKGYEGIIKNFIKENEDGTISLTRCCAVAGLGGTPYRSGSFEYYVSEDIRDNDPKGVGPFIMASLEYEKL